LADPQARLAFAEGDLGVGNRLTLLDDEIQKNLGEIQLRHGLPPSGTLASGDFTVEMRPAPARPTSTYARSSS
jgi:type III restriction enzyme